MLASFRTRLSERSQKQQNGCVLYTGQNNGTYGQIEYQRRTYLAHRVAFMLSKGEIPEGSCVCHTCDTPLCINPDHLWIGSYQANVTDMMDKGRQNFVGKITFPQETIDLIRSRVARGDLQREIAADLGVSQAHISYVSRGLKRKRASNANT